MTDTASAMININEYLKELTFKRRVFGGRKPADIVEKFDSVTQMFRELITETGEMIAKNRKTLAETAAMCEELEKIRRENHEQISSLYRRLHAAAELESKNHELERELAVKTEEQSRLSRRAESDSRRALYNAQERCRELLRAREREIELALESKRAELDAITAELDLAIEERNNAVTDFRVAAQAVEDELERLLRKAELAITAAEGGKSPPPACEVAEAKIHYLAR